MKHARNLFLALALLVLLYGGAYWFFYREKMLAHYPLGGFPRFGGSSTDNALRTIYSPAVEIDGRWNVDRPVKKLLRGHWRSKKPGDFLTITKDGKCSFQLGGFKASADLTFNREYPGYHGKFQNGGTSYWFKVSIAASGQADANIITGGGLEQHPFPNLTRAPDPAP